MRASNSVGLVVGKGVVEAEHRHAVLDRRELLGPRRPDPQARRVVADQLREAVLDVEVAALERVVLGVAYRRRVLLVIAQVMSRQRTSASHASSASAWSLVRGRRSIWDSGEFEGGRLAKGGEWWEAFSGGIGLAAGVSSHAMNLPRTSRGVHSRSSTPESRIGRRT
jgi:hypothetical protein